MDAVAISVLAQSKTGKMGNRGKLYNVSILYQSKQNDIHKIVYINKKDYWDHIRANYERNKQFGITRPGVQ
jgi:hypothetical protein